MITLYQFNISHFCEKAKWALDYKGLEYKTINLIPGPHILWAKSMAPKTSVPIIKDKDKIIQDSTDIINYLDQNYPEPPLTPKEPQLKKQAIEWEEYCDKEIGPHLRRFFYYHILPDRQLATSLILQNAPAYGSALYFFMFPMVRLLMKKSMKIDAQSSTRSEARLTAALQRLDQELADKKYLVGDHFSRADLAAASLLAPLFNPPEHPMKWPEDDLLPEVLQNYLKKYESSRVAEWIRGLYAFYRPRGSAS